MNIDWFWRPVPELRGLPRHERNRLWRRCSGRAMLSWRFALSMVLNLLAIVLVMFPAGLLGTWLWSKRVDAMWINLAMGIIIFPLLPVASTLAMQPWIKETRRHIRLERETSAAS